MILDITIIVFYFVIVMAIGIYKKVSKTSLSDEFFLSSRSLKWPSIALSTIATNIHTGHFLGMAGSAYVFGLAQANLEINAITGILIAALFFIPLYLKERITTISQFFEIRLGPKIAITYSILMILLYSFVFIGTALFWGGYAVNAIFSHSVQFIHSDPMVRIFIISILLGVFSAIYTFFGGLGAVVRTDIVQFVILSVGGIILLTLSLNELGGVDMLYKKSGNLMHLHLSHDHKYLPWPALAGIFLLNLNYWGANQVILQRAIAAKNLFHAQLGLIVGGFLKYLMAVIIIIPAIALAGIMIDNPLNDPDLTYPTIVNKFLPIGLRGFIMCGLFASLMSSVDSIYHSVATLWSIDIYKRYIKPNANDRAVMQFGRYTIFFTLFTGIAFAWVNVYVKFENPGFALTHWFNEVSYYIKNSFVLLIICAVFLVSPAKKLVLYVLFGSIVGTAVLKLTLPDMNYFNRSTIVIVIASLVVALHTWLRARPNQLKQGFITVSNRTIGLLSIILLLSLIVCHLIFH